MSGSPGVRVSGRTSSLTPRHPATTSEASNDPSLTTTSAASNHPTISASDRARRVARRQASSNRGRRPRSRHLAPWSPSGSGACSSTPRQSSRRDSAAAAARPARAVPGDGHGRAADDRRDRDHPEADDERYADAGDQARKEDAPDLVVPSRCPSLKGGKFACNRFCFA